MNHFRERLKQIKKNPEKNVITIPFKSKIISLKPVDTSEDTIRLMTEWRNKFWQGFLTKFHATEERTKNWLQKEVIDNENRILFLILIDEKKIGHIGIHRYDEMINTADIDNVLRGVRNDFPRIMGEVIKAIFKLMFKELKLSRVQLRVFSDNHKAISLYERSSMVTVDSIPLKRFFTDDGWVWKEIELKKDEGVGEKRLNVMEIKLQDFKE